MLILSASTLLLTRPAGTEWWHRTSGTWCTLEQPDLTLEYHHASPVNRSSNLIGTLRHIDSIALRVGRPSQPSHRRIPSYVSRSLGHTNAEVNPTMPKMCSGSFHVLQRLNNSCAIYAIYSVVITCQLSYIFF